jgi:hypothetical protein
MHNQIENIIRKIIFERKQKDALLESIIKRSLFEDDEPAAKVARRRTTILRKAPKDVRAVAAKYKGIAYQVVIRGKQLGIGEINNIVHGKSAGNSQIGSMSPPWNSGEYTYIISTTADIDTTNSYRRYVVNVLVIPNSILDAYKLPKKQQTDSSIIGQIGSSNMIHVRILEHNYSKLPKDLIDALQVKRSSKYNLDFNFNYNTNSEENADETDIISNVTNQPIGTDGAMFTGIYNATKGIPVEGTFKHRNTTLNGIFSYDDTDNTWWFSKGIWQTPDQTRDGTFTKNGVFTDGKYQFTNRDAVDSMPEISYRVYHGFKTGKAVDTTNDKSKIYAYDASNKVIAYYEGTFNLDGDPKTGKLYSDDTRTTIIGTYTNGNYEAKSE